MFRSYHLLELSLFKIENGFNPQLILRVLGAPAYCRQVCGEPQKLHFLRVLCVTAVQSKKSQNFSPKIHLTFNYLKITFYFQIAGGNEPCNRFLTRYFS